MRTASLLSLALCIASAGAMPQAGKNPQKAREKQSGPKRSATQAITGCLDQRGESYVLTELTEMRKVTTLKGEAFSDDNFARYVGHKVTAHGRIENAEGSTVMRVMKIVDIQEGCSP